MLETIKNRACILLETACMLILITITVFALMQVCGRYLFLHTFFWVEEVTALLLGWMVACGVPLIWLREEHIAVDMIDALLPARVRATWDTVIQLLAVGVGGVIAYSGLRAVRQNIGFSISMLRYDESIRFYWVPVMGILLMLSACLTLAIRYQKRKGADQK